MTIDPQVMVPRVAFVVDLNDASSRQADAARQHHLVQLFRSHRVPATWVVGSVEQAVFLGEDRSSRNTLALSFGSENISGKQLRDQLASQMMGLSTAGGQAIETVVGAPKVLRAQANLLADQGVRAVVSTAQPSGGEVPPRSLPMGLWQFTPAVRIPHPGRLSRLLRSRAAAVKQIVTRPAQSATVVAIDSAQLGRLKPRKLRQLEKFVREIAWAASRGQLMLTTLGEFASDLTSATEVQPQQSILRVAA